MSWNIHILLPWFASGTSLVLMLVLVLGSRPARARSRLSGLAREMSPSAERAPQAPLPPRPAGSPIARATSSQAREQLKNGLRDRIVQAGIYSKHAPLWFAGIRAGLFLAMASLGIAAAYAADLPALPALAVGALSGLGATLAPTLWLDHLRASRQTRIRHALPDALDLIGVCLQGGLSLPGSLSRVALELGRSHPLLAVELAIVEREIQMGLTAGEAMRQLARRFDLEELRSLSSVISQAERFGSSVNQALRTYAESLRTKRRQHAEEMAQKAAIKILFPTLLCIFPGIFIVVLGPAAMRIYEAFVVNSPWN